MVVFAISIVYLLTAVHVECITPPNVHPTPTCITACDEFCPASPHVNTASDKCWGGYEASVLPQDTESPWEKDYNNKKD